MKLYWGLPSIPELTDLTKAQRMTLWRAALKANLHRPRIWITYLLTFSIVGLGVMLIPRLVFDGPGGIVLVALSCGLWSGVWTLLGNQIAIRALRPWLAARRAAMAPPPSSETDGYYVPPAF